MTTATYMEPFVTYSKSNPLFAVCLPIPFLVSECLGCVLITDPLKGMTTSPWCSDSKTVDWNLQSVRCAFFLSLVFYPIQQQLVVFCSCSSKWWALKKLRHTVLLSPVMGHIGTVELLKAQCSLASIFNLLPELGLSTF